MQGPFASPHILSALAVSSRGDPDLLDGTQLRLLPSSQLGWPLSPFLVWPVPVRIVSRDKVAGPLTVVPDTTDRKVAIQVLADPARKLAVSLIDRLGGRTIATRTSSPWMLAAPIVDRLAVAGGGGDEFIVYGVDRERALGLLLETDPIAQLALPVDERLPWYAGGRGRDAALARVAAAAPRRLTPLDRPDGPFDALPEDDEVRRVSVQAEALDPLVARMLGDAQTPPWLAEIRVSGPPRPNTPPDRAGFPIAPMLQLAACDPGIGRYLGLGGLIDGPGDGEVPRAYAAAAVFALDPARLVNGGRPSDILDLPVTSEDNLVAHMVRLVPDLDRIVDEQRKAGRMVRFMATVAAAPPPPDPPAIAAPTLRKAAWIGAEAPSRRFRQGFAFADTSLGVVAAMGRLDPAGWQARAVPVDVPGASVSPRRTPMLIGRSVVDRQPGIGLLFDRDIPGDAGVVRYRFALSDLFGRFGPPVDIDVPPPPRPAPPAPVPAVQVVEAEVDRDAPGSLSPGSIHVTVPVPRIEDLAAGALSIATLEVVFAGSAPTSMPVPGPVIRFDRPLQNLAPMTDGAWPLVLTFLDEAGQHSSPHQEVVRASDRRRPIPVPSGPGLIWTSRPGPAEEVELDLRWLADARLAYRAYISDARGIGATGPNRAAIALAGTDPAVPKQVAAADARRGFRLLNSEPVTGGPDGFAHLRATLPRALRTVQFLKVVPVTQNGTEAAFDACAMVPVAVPSDVRPPPPRLTVALGPDRASAVLAVEAGGLDLPALQAAEPGLFEDPIRPSAHRPEIRFKRASGPVPDPVYARPVGAGPIAIEPSGPSGARLFRAETTDPAPGAALIPFVRYTYWAELRLPAERRLPEGAMAAPVIGGVEGAHPAQMRDALGSYSRPSNPVSLIPYPAEAPAVLAAGQVVVSLARIDGATSLVLKVTGLPVSHEHAISQFRLRLWRGPPGRALSFHSDTPITAPVLERSIPLDADPVKLAVALALIDPLNRAGASTMFEAT